MNSSSPTAATPNPLEVYELEDLRHWEQRHPAPSLAVLGHPVSHSVSPQMHNTALNHLRAKSPEMVEQLAGLEYFKFDIKPAELEEALDLLFKKNFWGVNLTVPHKEAAAQVLLKTGGKIHARGAKSINTLIPGKDAWEGHNTDGYGLAQALERELKVQLNGKTVVILGAGGAAYGAAVECRHEHCAALWIGNRSVERLDGLVTELRGLNQRMNQAAKGRRPAMADEAIRSFALGEPPVREWPDDVVVINATTLGMKRGDALPLDVGLLGAKASVLDMIYRRGGQTTAMVAMARARGLQAADGVAMLVWQGAAAFTLWLSANLQILIKPQSIAQIMKDAADEALGRKKEPTPSDD